MSGEKNQAQTEELSEDVSQFGALWKNPPPFIISWGSVSCQSCAGPSHNGRGTYIYRLSPMGDLSALAVNERKAKDTRVLFYSPLTQGGLSSRVYPQQKDTQTGRYGLRL